jgi:methionyl-tRNA formyltransferase
VLARADREWEARAVADLRRRYPAPLDGVPVLEVESPNSGVAQAFLRALAPDVIVARCKLLLEPAVFKLARVGAFALHPGICPEYRNAHGCFWALAGRDLDRVGMTLLRIDEGVDTGPIYLQASCDIDEVRESHTVIQQRVVLENLDAIARTIGSLAAGEPLTPLSTDGRRSAVWGHPRLSRYLRWKWMARRDRHDANRCTAVS